MAINLSLIHARVNPAQRHLIEPGALLSDLLDEIALWGLRDDIERTLNIEISDADLDRCQTVQDIADTVERLRRVEA